MEFLSAQGVCNLQATETDRERERGGEREFDFIDEMKSNVSLILIGTGKSLIFYVWPNTVRAGRRQVGKLVRKTYGTCQLTFVHKCISKGSRGESIHFDAAGDPYQHHTWFD